MPRIHDRGHLQPIERELAKTLYTRHGQSGIKIAELMGCSKHTIYRIVKGLKRGEQTPIPQSIIDQLSKDTELRETKHAASWTLPPLEFRLAKMREIETDIELTRARGSVNVLPQLHKLHLAVYEDMQQLKEELSELADNQTPEQLLTIIIETIMSLPPTLRHQILTTMEDMESGKVIRL